MPAIEKDNVEKSIANELELGKLNTAEITPVVPNFGRWIAFLTSCIVHLFFCVVLACIYTLGGGDDQGGAITLALESASDSVSLSSQSFETATLQAESIIPENPISETLATTTLASFTSSTELLQQSESEESLSETVRSALTSIEDSLSDSFGDTSGQTAAKFYGNALVGNRFVFVIDSSSSMGGERWQSLKEELIRCIQSLSPDQRFFVIGFDSESRPMFGQAPPRGSFLRPSKISIKKLQNWLNGIRLGSQTLPASSLSMAISLKPDAIMLLSDGEIADDSILRLRRINRRMTSDDEYEIVVPIHTYLLHSAVGYKALVTIANENDGVFTPINLSQPKKRRR